MTLSQKTSLSVNTNNFGGKWVVWKRPVEHWRVFITPTTLKGSGDGGNIYFIHCRVDRHQGCTYGVAIFFCGIST